VAFAAETRIVGAAKWVSCAASPGIGFNAGQVPYDCPHSVNPRMRAVVFLLADAFRTSLPFAAGIDISHLEMYHAIRCSSGTLINAAFSAAPGCAAMFSTYKTVRRMGGRSYSGLSDVRQLIVAEESANERRQFSVAIYGNVNSPEQTGTSAIPTSPYGPPPPQKCETSLTTSSKSILAFY
jgi:hypothetical protein